MTKKLARPRWIQRIRALIGGYFWLPCPVCGQYFGGHEWKDSTDIKKEWTWEMIPGIIALEPYSCSGWGTCGECEDRVIEINEKSKAEFIRNNPKPI